MKVMITGATGLVGTELVKALMQEGHELVVLSSNASRAQKQFPQAQCVSWQQLDDELELLAQLNGVIHLAGENIAAKRWSESQKKKIYHSRIHNTQKLVKALQQAKPRALEAFISTSAIGIYGDRQDEVLNEDSHIGDKNLFLTQVCVDWEKQALQMQSLCRVCVLRVGIVLSRKGGALAKMLPAFQMAAGAVLGDGRQQMSWIHIQDLVRLYLTCLKDSQYKGVFNATAPEPVNNREFSQALAKSLARPLIFTAPSWLLKLALGEMSQILLQGQKVLPQRAMELGFRFNYPQLELALKDL